MSYTAARVNVGGLPYRVEGAQKKTLTDVTVTTNSEVVTAADLGLATIYGAQPEINTGVATDTGVYATAIIAASGASITLAEFAAAGTAATTATGTIIRVAASGY